MTASSHISTSKLRAAIAAVALLACWMSVSAALAAQSPDVCSMTCCIQEGHCCCTPHHAYVKGQGPDGRDAFVQATVTSTCPGGCTTSQSISRVSFDDPGAAPGHSVWLVGSTLNSTVESVDIRAVNRDLSDDPRGPPRSSLRPFQS